MRDEARNWWRQSQADLAAAKDIAKQGHWYLAAFLSHQAVEKGLKALYIVERRESVRTHNLVRLARELDLPDELVEACATLNPDYLNARYPDAPTGVPQENYTEGMAVDRMEKARKVIDWIEKRLDT